MLAPTSSTAAVSVTVNGGAIGNIGAAYRPPVRMGGGGYFHDKNTAYVMSVETNGNVNLYGPLSEGKNNYFNTLVWPKRYTNAAAFPDVAAYGCVLPGAKAGSAAAAKTLYDPITLATARHVANGPNGGVHWMAVRNGYVIVSAMSVNYGSIPANSSVTLAAPPAGFATDGWALGFMGWQYDGSKGVPVCCKISSAGITVYNNRSTAFSLNNFCFTVCYPIRQMSVWAAPGTAVLTLPSGKGSGAVSAKPVVISVPADANAAIVSTSAQGASKKVWSDTVKGCGVCGSDIAATGSSYSNLLFDTLNAGCRPNVTVYTSYAYEADGGVTGYGACHINTDGTLRCWDAVSGNTHSKDFIHGIYPVSN
jgi:WD40 repeat protein